MALLLNHEVVGITCSAKIQVMPALSHGHQLTCSSTRSMKFPTFHDSLNNKLMLFILPTKVYTAAFAKASWQCKRKDTNK